MTAWVPPAWSRPGLPPGRSCLSAWCRRLSSTALVRAWFGGPSRPTAASVTEVSRDTIRPILASLSLAAVSSAAGSIDTVPLRWNRSPSLTCWDGVRSAGKQTRPVRHLNADDRAVLRKDGCHEHERSAQCGLLQRGRSRRRRVGCPGRWRIPAPLNGEGVRATPFWSLQSRAEKLIRTVPAYAGFTTMQIQLREWRER